MKLLYKYQQGNKINLNITNKKNSLPINGWGENVNWLGDDYKDIGVLIGNKRLTGNIGNYFPIKTREQSGIINPYVGLNYDLNKNISLGLNVSPDYKGITLSKSFKSGGIIYKKGNKLKVTADNEKHVVYKKESPTGQGEGVEGHIMVNHPTKDKGKWDTIDLTEITNNKVKTVKQGVQAVKKWHKENPYKK